MKKKVSGLLLIAVLLSALASQVQAVPSLTWFYNNGFSENAAACTFSETDDGAIAQPMNSCGAFTANTTEVAVQKSLSGSIPARNPVVCVEITRYESTSTKWNYRVGIRSSNGVDWYICDVSTSTDKCTIIVPTGSGSWSYDAIAIRTKNSVNGALGGVSNLKMGYMPPGPCP